MNITLAIEWFLNPDHLPFIVGMREGIFEKHGLSLAMIEPDEHYDGLEELRKGSIAFATNEPLHLIEQFNENMLSLGSFFETRGGVLLKSASYDKAFRGETLIVTTPVSNPTTDSIGFEILRRFYEQKGLVLKPEQVVFIPNGFEHIRYMQEGADAGWLYFYNFEGIEAKHEGLEVLYLDAENVGFANFSALDLFTHRTFYENNKETVETFVNAVRESIAFIQSHPKEAKAHYYAYSAETPTALMDDIIDATLGCFDATFDSSYNKALDVLEFFREIGITNLKKERFRGAFLR